ncbi:MAG TPA: aminodeoxychorismate lyase [Gammaproteobacteria bacterium]
MTALWLVNGRPGAVDPADRGLAYGDGLFETMAAEGGRIRFLDFHLDRLCSSCERLGIPGPDREALKAEIEAHCPRAGRAVMKLVWTRGPGERGYRPPAQPNPTRILSISSWPAYPDSHYTRGVRVKTCALRLGESPALAGMKHLNRLEQVLARMELDERDAEEGLLLDAGGRVVGCTSSNVFAVRGGGLATPALDRCGVRGVMRRAVLECAAAHGLAAEERDLSPEALREADEMFLTNAVFGIWPVRRLDGRELAPGPVTRRLMELLGYGPRG